MASAIYPLFKQYLLGGGGLNLDTADMRVILIDSGDYTYNAAHDFLDDVAAAGRELVTATLQNTTIASGVFDADDITTAGGIAATVEALILYYHSGVEGTSRLICYIDGLSIPITANDITIRWNVAGIFAL